MSAFILAPDASHDLDAIWDYYGLELHNPDAADRIIDDLFAAMRLLAKSPGIGHFRSDLSRNRCVSGTYAAILLFIVLRLRRFRSFACSTRRKMLKQFCEMSRASALTGVVIQVWVAEGNLWN
jgi:plasmid stabilization system protein ParE